MYSALAEYITDFQISYYLTKTSISINSACQWHKQALSVDVSLTVAVAPKGYIAATKTMLNINMCKYEAVLGTLAKVSQGSSPSCDPLLPVVPPLIPFPVISLSCPI